MTSVKNLAAALAWASGLAATAAFVTLGFAEPTQIPTTLEDFYLDGTQPNTLKHPIMDTSNCAVCHGIYDVAHEPFRNWAASMMGQSARDPLFHAALAIANQDAAFGGDMCLRCHTPGGWLAGRSVPTDGSALEKADMQGVNCNFCHRMVDPVYEKGVSPAADAGILAALDALPVGAHTGNYVVDPNDVRRGPFVMGKDFFYHEWAHSPFHQESAMCATCHDVSNPVYTRQPDGSYRLGDLDAPHETQNKYDMFPIERTYSEWLMSAFAQGPIDMGGRFGGNKLEVSTCQDCHMPDVTAQGCRFEAEREDMPLHSFSGGGTWVLQAIRNLYPDQETFLDDESVPQAIDRAEQMLRAASDLEVTQEGSDLRVRIINQSAHKLPTGYPEGRRMWINARFYDAANNLIAEHGAYDPATAVLNTSNTKVYEAKLGLDDHAAAATGRPAGESFHFVLNNVWLKDNRIPPRGFTNAGFAAVQAAPVGAIYADGQHWDDTVFQVPSGAARVEVRTFYQTASKEYVEFLRDENRTNNAGQVLYEQWELLGKGAPVEMGFAELTLEGACPADLFPPNNPDGVVNFFDLSEFLALYNQQDPAADFAAPFGVLNFFDLAAYLDAFNAGCP